MATSSTIDRASSQPGTPKGMRASMTMGEVNGIMDPQNTSELSGALKAYRAMKKPSISGTVTGSCNCVESPSFSTELPMAAKSDAYSR